MRAVRDRASVRLAHGAQFPRQRQPPHPPLHIGQSGDAVQKAAPPPGATPPCCCGRQHLQSARRSEPSPRGRACYPSRIFSTPMPPVMALKRFTKSAAPSSNVVRASFSRNSALFVTAGRQPFRRHRQQLAAELARTTLPRSSGPTISTGFDQAGPERLRQSASPGHHRPRGARRRHL